MAGEPGVGKSTLLLDVGHRFAERNGTVLYVSGEESRADRTSRPAHWGPAPEFAHRRRDRTGATARPRHSGGATPTADRGLGADHRHLVDRFPARAASRRSIEVTQTITQWAKSHGLPTLLVGQSTRENSVAGPRARAPRGHRCHLRGRPHLGAADAAIGEEPLRARPTRWPVSSTTSRVCGRSRTHRFCSAKVREEPVAGSCLTVTMEGDDPCSPRSRGLVSVTGAPAPRRAATGLELNRTTMLVTVTEKAGKLQLSNRDVYAATVGGAKVSDPGSDLAVCLAIASARLDTPLWTDTVAIGEVTLSGDPRVVPGLAKRISEAARLGFTRVIIPADAGNNPEVVRAAEGLTVQPINRPSDPFGTLHRAPALEAERPDLHAVNAPF